MSITHAESATEVIAGGLDDFLAVRHLAVGGSQREIGRQLAAEATRRGWTPDPIDPVVNRARATWFANNWPQHAERMRGVADHLGLDSVEGAKSMADLSLTADRQFACSALWCPPGNSTDGHGRVARNYDFFTASMAGLMAEFGGGDGSGASGTADVPDNDVPDDDAPMCSRPYVISTMPDSGYATTVLTMNELDGCMDGINEKGLMVTLLIADVENVQPPPPGLGGQVGIGSAQLPRFVLETCADVEEAKQALLTAKHYDHGSPLHYLIADASGRAFVWERGEFGTEHIIERDAASPCVTNHPLHLHPSVDALPPDNEESFRTYERAHTLTKRSQGARFSAAGLRELIDEVEMEPAPGFPWRTIWRSIYDLSERTMSLRFYLGDAPDGTNRHSTKRHSTNRHGTNRHSTEITFRPGSAEPIEAVAR